MDNKSLADAPVDNRFPALRFVLESGEETPESLEQLSNKPKQSKVYRTIFFITIGYVIERVTTESIIFLKSAWLNSRNARPKLQVRNRNHWIRKHFAAY